MSSDSRPSYDPHSTDSMFATILQRMNGQDEQLAKILAQSEKTNGRVTAIERWRDVAKAKLAVISTIVSGAVAFAAWCFEKLQS